MSEENVEIVRRCYAALDRRDWESLWDASAARHRQQRAFDQELPTCEATLWARMRAVVEARRGVSNRSPAPTPQCGQSLIDLAAAAEIVADLGTDHLEASRGRVLVGELLGDDE